MINYIWYHCKGVLCKNIVAEEALQTRYREKVDVYEGAFQVEEEEEWTTQDPAK